MHGQTQLGPIWELVWDLLGKLLGPIWVPREIPLGSQWNPIIIPQVGPRWVAHKGPIIFPIWPPVGSHMCVLTGSYLLMSNRSAEVEGGRQRERERGGGGECKAVRDDEAENEKDDSCPWKTHAAGQDAFTGNRKLRVKGDYSMKSKRVILPFDVLPTSVRPVGLGLTFV